MKIRCWKCRGSGRIHKDPSTLADWLFTAGIGPLVKGLVESDPSDDRWYADCRICDGSGYQEENNARR